MVNPSKAKGTKFESDVVTYLQEHGFPHAERRAQHGNQDRGDIAGVVGWVLEAKSVKQIALAEFMSELDREMTNAKAQWGAVIVKARRRGIADAYCVMTLGQLARLLQDPPE